jgi:hypothetical protein
MFAIVEFDNSKVGEEERFAMRYVAAAFLDWQVCLSFFLAVLAG